MNPKYYGPDLHHQDRDDDQYFLRYIERELRFSQDRVTDLEKKNRNLTQLATKYRSKWIIADRCVTFAEREIAEDSDYWVDAYSCGQPGLHTASPKPRSR